MQYSQFEKALAAIYSVKEKNLGAFRARLRHLRNLGVPDIPKRGSGNVFIYKTSDILAASVALELQSLGSAPAVSAELATFALRHFHLVESSQADVFLVMTNTPEQDNSTYLEARVRPIRVKRDAEPPAGLRQSAASARRERLRSDEECGRRKHQCIRHCRR